MPGNNSSDVSENGTPSQRIVHTRSALESGQSVANHTKLGKSLTQFATDFVIDVRPLKEELRAHS